MGLASSQARLLNLTSRMHDIEYKAQKLEAQKLQMANESTQVYQEYENALNTTKLQFKQINNDGSAAYVDATYDLLTQSGYFVSWLGTGLDANTRKMIVTEADKTLFFNAVGGSIEKFAAVKSGMCEVKKVGSVDNCVTLAGTDTICIFTVEDLKKHASTNTSKILMNDLVVDTSSGYLATNLCGTFDGNGHTITVRGKDGIFNNLKGATVKNLNIEININENSANTGGLANNVTGDSTVENINLEGAINNGCNSETSIGALVGKVSNSYDLTVHNITSNVNITYTGSGSINIGGVIGSFNTGDLKINNAIYDGSIEANNSTSARCGGIVGLVATNNIGTVNIADCESSGIISANKSTNYTSNGSGGIAGTVWAGEAHQPSQNITNSYSTMDVNANESAAGGISGYAQVMINNCNATGTISSAKSGQIRGTGIGGDNSNPQCNATGSNKISTQVDHTQESTYNYYLEVGKALANGNYEISGAYINNATWLSEMLNSAHILLSKMDADNNIFDVNIATDTSLQEVSDETLLKKAEAKYEADMRKINQKDKKFDTELAAMDAERNAVKTEMDTLKSVAKENVDRTFKLFG